MGHNAYAGSGAQGGPGFEGFQGFSGNGFASDFFRGFGGVEDVGPKFLLLTMSFHPCTDSMRMLMSFSCLNLLLEGHLQLSDLQTLR